jgi:hypothetical protein
VRFHDVTGYLVWNAQAPNSLQLSFLPPPPAPPALGGTSSPISLLGTRGTPLPAPTPLGTAGVGGTAVAGTAVVPGTPAPFPTVGPPATPVPPGGTIVLDYPPARSTVAVSVGTHIVLQAPGAYTLGSVTYDARILAAEGRTAEGGLRFTAIAPGRTPLTATASPRCLQSHPACALPSLLLFYDVEVAGG